MKNKVTLSDEIENPTEFDIEMEKFLAWCEGNDLPVIAMIDGQSYGYDFALKKSLMTPETLAAASFFMMNQGDIEKALEICKSHKCNAIVTRDWQEIVIACDLKYNRLYRLANKYEYNFVCYAVVRKSSTDSTVCVADAAGSDPRMLEFIEYTKEPHFMAYMRAIFERGCFNEKKTVH